MAKIARVNVAVEETVAVETPVQDVAVPEIARLVPIEAALCEGRSMLGFDEKYNTTPDIHGVRVSQVTSAVFVDMGLLKANEGLVDRVLRYGMDRWFSSQAADVKHKLDPATGEPVNAVISPLQRLTDFVACFNQGLPIKPRAVRDTSSPKRVYTASILSDDMIQSMALFSLKTASDKARGIKVVTTLQEWNTVNYPRLLADGEKLAGFLAKQSVVSLIASMTEKRDALIRERDAKKAMSKTVEEFDC